MAWRSMLPSFYMYRASVAIEKYSENSLYLWERAAVRA